MIGITNLKTIILIIFVCIDYLNEMYDLVNVFKYV